jgi:uncharacterized protein YjdB
MTNGTRVRTEWIRCSLLLSVLISGCESVSPAVPDEVQMSGTAQVRVGVQEQFSALLFSRGQRIPNSSFLWSSSNPNVIAVDGSGRVTPLSRGSSTVSASAVGAPLRSSVTVAALGIQSVIVQPTAVSLEAGDAVQLTAQILADPGITPGLVQWTSNNVSVATVGSTGLLTALQPGQASITARSDGINGTASVLVSAVSVASVRLDQASATLFEGERLTLSAISLDKRGNTLSGRAVSWESSNPSVASVTSGGVITAVSAGRVSITVRSDGQAASAQLEVKRRTVASVAVVTNGNLLYLGETLTAAVTVRDAFGVPLSDRPVAWSSSNSSVAAVSTTGQITAVSPGAVVITAAVEGVQGTVTVEVKRRTVASVAVATNGNILNVGQTLTATATASDASGVTVAGGPVLWSSSNSSVAAVSTSGQITAVSMGTAVITAAIEGVQGSVTVLVGLGAGQTVTGLSSVNGSALLDLNVQTSASPLVVRTFGGAGNVNLYLTSPTGSRVCSSISSFNSTNTACLVFSPAVGRWRALLESSYSNVSLQVNPVLPALNVGQTLTGLSSQNGSVILEIPVAPGSPSLVIRTLSGSGDVNQYLYSPTGGRPCSSISSFNSTNTLCSVTNPQSGTWRVVLESTFSGVSIQATF